MSEIINDKKVFSLFEVTSSVQRTISERYKSSFWIMAEMNKLNHYPHSGHCYPELVEKKDGKVIAQMKANLWKNDFVKVNDKFLALLKEPIKDGIKILFSATLQFDPTYGLSLRILDIDPGFSLGELEREKQETIENLKKEGIFTNNKSLQLPLLPQRIAVISVETSKGYSDFLNIIGNNHWGYKFFHLLFPALLQGERSNTSMINQLRRIKKVITHFDVVAIIRGGGGDIGLSSYNNYALSREIALFPIPILTGIGHSTNETVVEMVSFKNAITPTELADFLIQKFHNFSVPVKKAQESIIDKSKRMLIESNTEFHNAVKYFLSVTRNRLLISHNEINGHSKSLAQQSNFLIKRDRQTLALLKEDIKECASSLLIENSQKIKQILVKVERSLISFMRTQNITLQNLAKNLDVMNPVNVLKRGFTITLKNGRAIKHYLEAKAGDTITTVLADGKIVSTMRDSTRSETYE